MSLNFLNYQRMSRSFLAIAALALPLMTQPLSTPLADTFVCNPVDVATFNNRIHVRCSPANGAIKFFAVGTTNSDNANRFFTLVATAFSLNKQLTIFFNPDDLSGADFGCLTSDCRRMTGALMF